MVRNSPFGSSNEPFCTAERLMAATRCGPAFLCLRSRHNEMGKSVIRRQRPSRVVPAALATNPTASAHSAILAGATMALLVSLTLPAGALPLGFGDYGDSRAAPPRFAPDRPATNRAMRSRSSQTGPFSRDRAVKAEPSFSELAAKAKGKGPLRIIISLDKQQLTLYAGDEVI